MDNKTLMILIPIVVVLLIAILAVSGAVYTIDESQQVVITQFGKIIGEPITEPGMHFKMPFIHEPNYFDKRLLDWDGEKTVSKTLEQKFISVEVYARWRITNPKLYLETVSGIFETALSRLDATIDPIVRDVIARYTLNELIRSDTKNPIIEKVLRGSASALMGEETAAETEGVVAEAEGESGEEVAKDLFGAEQDVYEQQESWITHGRTKITTEIFESAKTEVTRYGIELADVRIKRINYQPETRRQVFSRMIAERRREEALYISQGEQQAAEIKGRMDREVKLIQSRAAEAVLKIIGEGEARAIETYAEAYSKDTNFYNFYKTLETLKVTMSESTFLILSTNSEFYSILKGSGATR